MNHSGYIYIMTNKNRTTLYIGVTNNLCRRIYEHKNHLIKGSFTDKYNLEYCIYYEEFPYFDLAIKREKELKKWNRQKKEDLINKKNPEWKVLVTEKGFVREKVSFAQQVNDLLNELQHNGEIPPFSRNDNAQCMNGEIPTCGRNNNSQSMNDKIPHVGRNDSAKNEQIPHVGRNNDAQSMNGEIPPCGQNGGTIGEQIPPSSRNDDSPCGEMREGSGGEAATSFTTLKEPHVISSEARNLNNETPVIPSEARNLSTCDNTVIPNGTKCSEEPPLSCQPPVIPSVARNLNNEPSVIPNGTNNQKFNNPTKKHD